MFVDVKLEGLDKLTYALNPKVYNQSLSRTINEIGRKMTTKMSQDVRANYNIKVKSLRRFIKVSRSSQGRLIFNIVISSKQRNVSNFGAKVLKKRGQVSIRIKKQGGRKVLKRAFKARNSPAILQRVDGSQEIRAVQTLSVPQMFNAKTLKKAEEIKDREFGKRFKKNLEFYISK